MEFLRSDLSVSFDELHVCGDVRRLNLIVIMKEVKNILLKSPRLEMRNCVEIQVDSDFMLLFTTGWYL